MESANRRLKAGEGTDGVQVAKDSDAPAIMRLLREAPFSHIHADWHYPGEWLGANSFVVIRDDNDNESRRSFGGPLFGPRDHMRACLAVAPDPPPAAWVRLAAVMRKSDGPLQMGAMFARIAEPLRAEGVSEIAWLLLEEWPEQWLPDLGFERVNEVITYVKSDMAIPAAKEVAGLTFRPVESNDFTALAAIESRAFDPLWRHSAHGLALAHQQSLSFDVACLEGRVVAFQFSSSSRRGAHLARIAVDPALQQGGIGTALLHYTLSGYQRLGITTATLNTQADNTISQRLYDRFGFLQNGERFPVWRAGLV
ncbi:MAG: GNAT family N-acetyltransferase [Candidatus Promineifilaceae bacterium]|jgi:ribosomal protein S18 acetylase RimI-like enzyme